MNIKHILLSVLLLVNFNVWAAETPAADSVPATQPAAVEEEVEVEVELPGAFTEAQPIPVAKSNIPAPFKPVVEIMPYQIEVGGNYSKLSNGYLDGGVYVAAEMALAKRNNIYGAVRKENRYTMNDREFSGGFYSPLNDYAALVVEGSMSPEHHFLPIRSLLGQVEYMGENEWSATVGLRHSAYNKVLVNSLIMTAEHFFGNYRVAYTRYQSFLSGNGTTNSNQVLAAKYYGDHNWVGVTFSNGKELETIAATQVLNSQVRTRTISGRHWLTPSVALVYTVGNYHQGIFYTRNGLQLGLRYQF